MVQRSSTVAFEGIEARAVDVQVQVAAGLPKFHVVGLPDKAERASGCARPWSPPYAELVQAWRYAAPQASPLKLLDGP
jgi:hypothetical protein